MLPVPRRGPARRATSAPTLGRSDGNVPNPTMNRASGANEGTDMSTRTQPEAKHWRPKLWVPAGSLQSFSPVDPEAANNVGRCSIQRFVGALAAGSSLRGIVIRSTAESVCVRSSPPGGFRPVVIDVAVPIRRPDRLVGACHVSGDVVRTRWQSAASCWAAQRPRRQSFRRASAEMSHNIR